MPPSSTTAYAGPTRAPVSHAPQNTTHAFGLRSAFGSDFGFTNYTHQFKGTIDYIWFTARSLCCEAVLAAVAPEHVAYAGCPNPHFPSDHIPIAARLSFA